MATHRSDINIHLLSDIAEKKKQKSEPVLTHRTHVATSSDGSQTLIYVLSDGTVTVAFRDNKWDSWGPPVIAVDMTQE